MLLDSIISFNYYVQLYSWNIKFSDPQENRKGFDITVEVEASQTADRGEQTMGEE